MTALLHAYGVRKQFGALTALDDVDLAFSTGVLTAIIGPNGAGKTTVVNVLSGALPLDRGRVTLQGEDITTLPPHARVRRGLTRSFQVLNIFPQLSVRENVLLPVLARRGGPLGAWARVDDDRAGVEEADRVLDAVGLRAQADRPAQTMPPGDQRRLELAIAIAPRPLLCFLDEPSSGMTPLERGAILDLIRRLARDEQTTFVIIEHDMDVVFSLAQRIVVMNRGQILADGPPQEIRSDPQVRQVYLGQEKTSGAS